MLGRYRVKAPTPQASASPRPAARESFRRSRSARAARGQHERGPAGQPRRRRERARLAEAVTREPMTPEPRTIARRREDSRPEIARAAARAGRDAAASLMAVTKAQRRRRRRSRRAPASFSSARTASRKASARSTPLRADFPGPRMASHRTFADQQGEDGATMLSGRETVDRERLAARLEALLAETGRVLPVLLEINLGAEESKPEPRPKSADGLARAVTCPHLELHGSWPSRLSMPTPSDRARTSPPCAIARPAWSDRLGRPFRSSRWG